MGGGGGWRKEEDYHCRRHHCYNYYYDNDHRQQHHSELSCCSSSHYDVMEMMMVRRMMTRRMVDPQDTKTAACQGVEFYAFTAPHEDTIQASCRRTTADQPWPSHTPATACSLLSSAFYRFLAAFR